MCLVLELWFELELLGNAVALLLGDASGDVDRGLKQAGSASRA